ncbi:RNA polymerase sigma factor FliA [Rhabdochromatium marinum]|nr:RNA polymerase sigma factor FliA [Rhabdochromatium marinum]
MQDYRSDADAVSPEQLVTGHVDLVRRIAHHLMARLPASVQVDDLIQSGMIGLIEAARQFQGGQGATFATYAGIRVRGAMIDELRRSDWAPRSVHRNSRRIAEAIQQVEAREGRAARDREIAAELQVSLDDFHAMLQDNASVQLLGLDELFGQDRDSDRLLPADGATPIEALERDAFRDALAEALATLPEKERLVLALYYNEELNLREIGAVMGITESRVCQIRSQSVHRLRARLQEWITSSATV